MTVYAITDTKKGEQGLRLLIFKLPELACVYIDNCRLKVGCSGPNSRCSFIQ